MNVDLPDRPHEALLRGRLAMAAPEHPRALMLDDVRLRAAVLRRRSRLTQLGSGSLAAAAVLASVLGTALIGAPGSATATPGGTAVIADSSAGLTPLTRLALTLLALLALLVGLGLATFTAALRPTAGSLVRRLDPRSLPVVGVLIGVCVAVNAAGAAFGAMLDTVVDRGWTAGSASYLALFVAPLAVVAVAGFALAAVSTALGVWVERSAQVRPGRAPRAGGGLFLRSGLILCSGLFGVVASVTLVGAQSVDSLAFTPQTRWMLIGGGLLVLVLLGLALSLALRSTPRAGRGRVRRAVALVVALAAAPMAGVMIHAVAIALVPIDHQGEGDLPGWGLVALGSGPAVLVLLAFLAAGSAAGGSDPGTLGRRVIVALRRTASVVSCALVGSVALLWSTTMDPAPDNAQPGLTAALALIGLVVALATTRAGDPGPGQR